MTNLEYNINKHMIDNFGKSIQYYINCSDTISDDISPSGFSDAFTKLYMKLYKNDLEFQNLDDKFKIALANDIVALDVLSDNYEKIRRVSHGLDLFLTNNRAHNINSSIILQIKEDNDKELESMKTPVIKDLEDIVISTVDARTILDEGTGIQKLYEINYYKKDDNMFRVVDVEYELYVEKEVRYFETSFTFPNFDVAKIEFYDLLNNKLENSDYILEKLRRNVNIYFNKPIKLKKILVTYCLQTDDKYISLGNSFVSNKNLYTETLESPINIDKEYNMIEFLNHPTYNYIAMSNYNVTMPSLDSENNKKVKKFHILENTQTLKLLLYPIPDDINDVTVFIYNPEYKEIPHTTSGSNLLIVESSDLVSNDLITGSKLYIKYLSTSSFYEYMDLEYIKDPIIYRRSGIEKKMTFKVDISESASIRNTFSFLEMYYRSNKYKSVVLEKMQDVIPVNVNFPSPTLTRQTITDEYPETNIYAYNIFKYSVQNTGNSIIVNLPRKYVTGMVKVFNSDRVEYKFKDWCDNITLKNTEIEIFGVTEYIDLYIYYTPVDDNVDIISNINNIKSDKMLAVVEDKKVIINQNDVVVDNFIVDNWHQENGVFKHKYFSSVYYEPFFTNDATITNIFIDDDSNILIELKEDVESINLYFHKKRSFNLVVNPAYTLNGYNPVVLVSEF